MLTAAGVELQRLLDSWPSLVESVGEVGVAGADPLSDSPLFSLAFTSDLARRNRSAAPEKRPATHNTHDKCNQTCLYPARHIPLWPRQLQIRCHVCVVHVIPKQTLSSLFHAGNLDDNRHLKPLHMLLITVLLQLWTQLDLQTFDVFNFFSCNMMSMYMQGDQKGPKVYR